MAGEQYRNWLDEQRGHRTVENLKKHGFSAYFTADAEEAADLILEITGRFTSFGFGGSSTTRALGLPEKLLHMGKTLFDHWDRSSDTPDLELRLKQGRADCFLCSANAISAGGEIVNVDGVGNRNNGMTFGCPHVIIAAGINKVTPDLDSALRRVREIAAPMRAKSLNMDTPCAKTGFCSDCNSPQRICRVTTILHRKPMMTEITVILINQSLGY